MATGKWLTEPDFKLWIDKATGLMCMVVRGTLGNLCGYVCVRSGYAFYWRDYGDVDVSVHGGLTFSGDTVPKVDIDWKDGWWFGFDCAHAGDYLPNLPMPFSRPENYCDMEYVTGECARLASQLAGSAS